MSLSTPGPRKGLSNTARALIALGVIAAIFTIYQVSTGGRRADDTPVVGSSGEERPMRTVYFTGTGEGASSNEERMGGDYDVLWTTEDCFYAFDLEGSDDVTVGSSQDSLSGGTTIYGMDEGTYHLKVITGAGCDWNVELRPR